MKISQLKLTLSFFLLTIFVYFGLHLKLVGGVQEAYAQFPELKWLADEAVEVTQQDCSKATSESYSVQLTKHYYPELDRTLLALQCLEWIWVGEKLGYEQMIQGQRNPQLTWQSFQSLHSSILEIANSFKDLSLQQVYDAFKVEIVLGDIGKSKKVRQSLGSEFLKIEDHDLFLEKIFSCDFILNQLPSYVALPTAAQQLLKDASGLGHFGHIVHMEGGPEMFNNLVRSKVLQKNPCIFEFAYMAYLCDVAASMGHVKATSSLVLNETTYHILELAKKGLLRLSTITPQEVYNDYLGARARMVGIESLKKPEDYLAGRFAAIMRLTDKEEGAYLKAAYAELKVQDQALVQSTFYDSIFGKSFLNTIETPTYMPAVMINLMNNAQLGDNVSIRIKQAFKIGSVFLAKVLIAWSQSNEFNLNTVVNFNEIAGLAKKDPKLLLDKKFKVNANSGKVEMLK